jgi:hypothetical protein
MDEVHDKVCLWARPEPTFVQHPSEMGTLFVNNTLKGSTPAISDLLIS